MKAHEATGLAANRVVAGESVSVQVVPAELNPKPLTVTTVPGEPLTGDRVMFGATVNV